jgi:hypothetical protein
MMFFLKYWKMAVTLAGILLVLIAFHLWMERECTRREVAISQAYQKMLDEERARSRAIERKMQTLVYEAEHANQARLQELEAKYRGAVERIGAVRVCNRATPADRVPRDSASSAVNHDPAGSDGLSGGAGGRDIGPGLVAIAHAADAQTARLIACQEYIRALEDSR